MYGPIGVAEFVDTLLSVSDTHLLMPVVIHEFDTGPPDLESWPPEEVSLGATSRSFITAHGLNACLRIFGCIISPRNADPALDSSRKQSLEEQRFY